MNKLMKCVWLLLICLFIVGCGNNKEDEMINFVEASSYGVIVDKLDKMIVNINMFPTQEDENAFIYLVQALVNNKDKFNSEELLSIYNKLQINYSFSFNNLGYTTSDYYHDLNKFYS